MLITLVALISCLVRLFRLALHRTRYPYRRLGEPKAPGFPSQPKPLWVRRAVIRLKALMCEAGTCRAIAQVFNRRFTTKRKMTVGRTWVNETIRKHQYEIRVPKKRSNHIRPHQNLNGLTPAEAWVGVDPYATGIKDEYWFEAWDGLLLADLVKEQIESDRRVLRAAGVQPE